MASVTKVYLWHEFRKWGDDVQTIIGEPIAAEKRYRVRASHLPAGFQERLRRDGFDVTRQVTFEAVIRPEGFGIEFYQCAKEGPE